ncbi:hypothetical protein ABW16_01820 [Mycolicibacter heraklionensis]|uniref:Uncharacterized protein n=1 Tax=Mycolicibacter heraklionensis TaxID=512402 RepID=A0ABR5FKN9_9MYCO|nr:hypothetical protein [Mycolicibacter heraklionensis]KLO31595.1 hypothetical protein ABW16_01820 [Mycolicibacter heraklionensis]
MDQPAATVAPRDASGTTMSEDERSAAVLIENNLGKLPGRDGNVIRLMQFSTFGRSDIAAGRINEARRDTAEAIVRLLTEHGYRVSR